MKSESINFMIGFWVQLVTCINQRKGLWYVGIFYFYFLCGLNRFYLFIYFIYFLFLKL